MLLEIKQVTNMCIECGKEFTWPRIKTICPDGCAKKRQARQSRDNIRKKRGSSVYDKPRLENKSTTNYTLKLYDKDGVTPKMLQDLTPERITKLSNERRLRYG